MPARFRIRDLLDRQGAALDRLSDRDARAFLRAYEDARRELREQLDVMVRTGADRKTPFSAAYLRSTMAQVEGGIRSLERRLGTVLDAATRRQRDQALEDLLAVVGRAERDQFTELSTRIETQALQRFVQQDGLLLHQHSIQRYGRDLVSKIQAELVGGVVRQLTLDQVVDRIVGTDQSVFAGMRHRAELIARMEMSRAYNEGHQASLEEASNVLDADEPDRPDPLVKRADEYLDKRNHPFSRALDGKIAPITVQVGDKHVPGEWEVPDSEVQAAAKAIGKRASGIVWRKEGSTWKGSMHPAHYNDRGRMTPWRSSWEEMDRTPVERPKWRPKARRGRPAETDEEPVKVREAAPRTGGARIPEAPTGLTVPSRQPDPNARPGGIPRKIRKDSDSARSDRRENEAAIMVAQAGFDIMQLPEKKDQKNPDYGIEGRIFDCYSPKPGHLNTVRRTFDGKIKAQQARRFILNLTDAPNLSVEDITRHFQEDPLEGLMEVLAVVDGRVLRIL